MAIPFPRQALAYGEPFYWDERYNAERAKHGKGHCFEWYCDLDDLWSDLGVPRCCGAFTPSMRVVSGRRGRGWSLFRFWGCSDRVERPRCSAQV